MPTLIVQEMSWPLNLTKHWNLHFISLKLLRVSLRLNSNLALELSFPSLAYSKTAVPFAWTFSSQVCIRYPAGIGPYRLQEALYRRQQKQFRLSGFPSEIPLPSLFSFFPPQEFRILASEKKNSELNPKRKYAFWKMHALRFRKTNKKLPCLQGQNRFCSAWAPWLCYSFCCLQVTQLTRCFLPYSPVCLFLRQNNAFVQRDATYKQIS